MLPIHSPNGPVLVNTDPNHQYDESEEKDSTHRHRKEMDGRGHRERPGEQEEQIAMVMMPLGINPLRASQSKLVAATCLIVKSSTPGVPGQGTPQKRHVLGPQQRRLVDHHHHAANHNEAANESQFQGIQNQGKGLGTAGSHESKNIGHHQELKGRLQPMHLG